MKPSLCLLACLGSFLLAGCLPDGRTPDAEPNRPYRGATFELSYPSHVTASADQGNGYAVHYFKVGQSKGQLGIYEGQRPKLFSNQDTDLTPLRRGYTPTRGDIEHGDDVWGVDGNALIWRESVWTCKRRVKGDDGKEYTLPTTLHIWYFRASEDEQLLFDSIIETIEMRQQ